MAANVNPIFTRLGDVQWIRDIVVANTTGDLTSGTSYLVFTADSVAGGFLRSLRFKPTPGTSPVQSVARIWLNNGSATTSAVNNICFTEATLPAITASATQSQIDIEVPMNIALPASFRVFITVATGMTGGWVATAIGGRY